MEVCEGDRGMLVVAVLGRPDGGRSFTVSPLVFTVLASVSGPSF